MGYELWFNRTAGTTGWSQATEIWLNIDGSTTGWKQVDEGWVNIDGTTTGWKQFYPEPIVPEFTWNDACYDEFNCTPVGTKFDGCCAWTVDNCNLDYHINIARSVSGGSYVTRSDTTICADSNCIAKSPCYSWATGGDANAGCYYDSACFSATTSTTVAYRMEIHDDATHTTQDQVIITKYAAGCGGV